MCGFIGWIDSELVNEETLLAMRDLMVHRGPDAAGVYLAPDKRAGLGFRRLSIIDLSPLGAQPMSHQSGSLGVVLMGEIYNFQELRSELSNNGYAFRSRTDTEVVVHAYEEWGEHCVDRFIGMFSFAIWDVRTETLFAARDRLGIKPFYYSSQPNRFLFASELKPIIANPEFRDELDWSALRDYLARGYVCSPNTIFRSVRSLPPAHVLSWNRSMPTPVIRRYWDPLDQWRRPEGSDSRSDGDWADELDDLLRSAIRYHLVSDVPLGAFLSGGVDSSLVVAMMRQVTTAEVKTFTIGFREESQDESRFADAVARHLATTHTPLTATHVEAQEVIPLLPVHYDEPFADSSQIATYLVSRLTRQHVTVALSGDGGDELFCGYQNYRTMARRQHAWKIPRWIRLPLSRTASLVGNDRFGRFLGGLGLPDGFAYAEATWRIWRPAEIESLVPEMPLEGDGHSNVAGVWTRRGMSVLDRMMMSDLQRYLPNDILTKVDRASMAVSLEARVPLLDHRLVEFALRLPLRLKWRHGSSKYLLRKVLNRYVPRALVDRPKHGFEVPLDQWLRGSLHGLVDRYLDRARLKQQGLFDPNVVHQRLTEFATRRRRHESIWSLLMFQLWWDRYACDRAAGARALRGN